jgi:transmembrane sensor
MMDKYSQFTAQDLVWDAYFRQWVLSPTRESEAEWTDWLRENPVFDERVRRAREIVLSLKVEESGLSDDEADELVTSTVSRLNQPQPARIPDGDRAVLPLAKRAWFRIAASVSILIVAGLLSKSYFHDVQPSTAVATDGILKMTNSTVKKVNETQQPMVVELADMSTVVLTPGSYIQYDDNFLGDSREVTLVGEAFFDVSKDRYRPFFVYANELVTKVLGTSFTIKAYPSSKQVIVEVKTGRVSVFAKSDPELQAKLTKRELQGVILSPNQKIIYEREIARMEKTLVERPEIVTPQTKVLQFEYEDVPASEVFASLGKAYGIEIIYDEDLLKGCPLTAALDNLPLHEQLSVICKAVEASYEIIDGQIYIHSLGCKN